MGTVKYTGPVASFHCPTNAEIRSLKVHFSPKQEGSGDPNPENVRPIVGWDGVVVEQSGENQRSTTNYEFGVLGKNKFNGEITHSNINSNGTVSGNSTRRITSLYIPVNHGTYTLSSNENFPFAIYTYEDNDGSSFLSEESLVNWNNSPATFTINNGRYISIKWKNFDDTDINISDISNIQLELGSTATAYESYDPNHAVYGGWVDLISGEVAEEWACINIPFDKTWDYSSSSYYLQDTNLPTINCAITNFIISHHKNTEIAANTSIYISSSKYWVFGTTVAENLNLNSSEEINIWLKEQADNGTPVQICGTLTSSAQIHYFLAPIQLQTFLGQNNVWSNADYVEVEYDLHETQDILARKQFIVANHPHIVKPAAAPLQKFVTDVPAPLKECKVYFEPKQDLHGYSNPWPAGGGKNIAKPYDNNYVSSTYVSFDYSAANGTFRCYGTASASSTHSSPSATNAVNNGATFTLPAGTYTLSIIDGDGTYIYAQCVSSTETVLAETTSYTSFTTNEALTVFVRLKVAAGGTVNNTVKIQLEAGSTATSYVPYENICPIEGWDGIETVKCGKNLFNVNRTEGSPNPTNLSNSTLPRIMDCTHYFVGLQSENYYYKNYTTATVSNGTITVTNKNNNSYGVGFPVCVKSNTTYTLSFTAQSSMVSFGYYDNEWNYLSKSTGSTGKNPRTITTPEKTCYMVIVFRAPQSETATYTYSNIQLELGSTATSYEPYTGTTIPITFPMLGKNYYNAEITTKTHNGVQWSGGKYYTIEASGIPTDYSCIVTSACEIPTSGKICLSANFNELTNIVWDNYSLYDSNMNRLISTGDGGTGYKVIDLDTYTDPKYIKLSFKRGNNNVAVSGIIKPMIEVGDTPTIYEAYNVVYGGYVDLINGELTLTHKLLTITGQETNASWSWNGYLIPKADSVNDNDIIHISHCSHTSRLVRGRYFYSSSNSTNTNDFIMCAASSGAQLRFRNRLITDNYSTNEEKLTAIKTWFQEQYSNGTPVQIVYELATVETYSIAPQTLKALRGTNNIWASNNGGNIEVSFWRH